MKGWDATWACPLGTPYYFFTHFLLLTFLCIIFAFYTMEPRLLLNHQQIQLTLERLCREIVENNISLENVVIIGLQPRGVLFSNQIVSLLKKLYPNLSLDYGLLDITFHRDDLRKNEKIHLPEKTEINFLIEGKHVILIDDVFYTGRSVRAALDALLSYGRPDKIELMVLIDRKYYQHVPVKPDYIGLEVDTIVSQKVKVEWHAEDATQNKIWILEA